MNNIEFRLLREELHLSQTELADLWQKPIRTIQRWEKGEFLIPQEYQDRLEKYLSDVNRSVKQFLLTLENLADGTESKIVLLAYNCWTYNGDFPHYKIHNSCIIKCKEVAKTLGFNVRLVQFKPDEYETWLDTIGKEDNQANRSVWASFQIK